MNIFLTEANRNDTGHKRAEECPIDGVALESYSHFCLGLVAINIRIHTNVVLDHEVLFKLILKH